MFYTMFSTLTDFEPYPSLIFFTVGCNLRCKYCYNYELFNATPKITLLDAIKEIQKHRNLISGVVISGGEPTLHQEELISFLEHVRSLDLKIKVDTNLTIPLNQKFIELINGVSVTLKPRGYYAKEHITNIFNNLKIVNDLEWKEFRITVVDDDFSLLSSISPLITDWKIRIDPAIIPEKGIFSDVKIPEESYYEYINKHILPYIEGASHVTIR